MPPMKNIHNLLTDAFNRINLNEGDYKKTVDDYYFITITSNNITGSATLDLRLNTNHELVDYYNENSLFMNDSWTEFCTTFDEQITQSNTGFITANDLFRSLVLRNLIPSNLIVPQIFDNDDDEMPPLLHNNAVPIEDTAIDTDTDED